MMSELKQRKLRNCNILPTTTIKIHMEGGEFKNQLSVRFHAYRVNKKTFPSSVTHIQSGLMDCASASLG